jgi:hypothetical protein
MFVGPRTYLNRSLWALARVEERFSGSLANVIVLRGVFQPGDQSRRYFVEGQRSGGALTRFLPIIEPSPCGRTAPSDFDFAAAALRTLRESATKADRLTK